MVSKSVCTLYDAYEIFDDGKTMEYHHLLDVYVNAFSRLMGNCLTPDGTARLVHSLATVVGVVVAVVDAAESG